MIDKKHSRFSEPGQRVPMSFRVTPRFKDAVDGAAAETGRSTAQEIELRLQSTFDAQAALEQAMVFEHASNAGLVHLVGEVIRTFTPKGEWSQGRGAATELGRALVRLLQRLGAPDQYDIADYELDATDPRRRVDQLLFELGSVNRFEPQQPTYLERWAATRRARLGELGDRLVKMHQVVREVVEAGPPREPPAVPDAGWAVSLAGVPDLVASAGGVVAVLRAEINKLSEIAAEDPEAAALQRIFLRGRVRMLIGDLAARAELLGLLAADPEVGFGPPIAPK